MHDLKEIVNNPKKFDIEMARRNIKNIAPKIVELDQKRRFLIKKSEELRADCNKLSESVSKGNDRFIVAEKVRSLKREESSIMQELIKIRESLNNLLVYLPNVLAADVPDGKDSGDNVLVRQYGDVPKFSFSARSHDQIGEDIGYLDSVHAAAMSGSRFSVLRHRLAKLERTLIYWMLDIHTKYHEYEEISPPLLVKSHALYATGQLPKFAEDLFNTQNDLWLIPTAEVSLTNLVRDSIFCSEELPKRFTAATSCFRSEAGAAGRDTRGIIRQHQFYKVELVSIVLPDEGEYELDRMIHCVENILKKLQLSYRIMKLCSSDTGFSAKKTYDFEVWMPYRKGYCEISSCSWMGNFQARRMNAKFSLGKKRDFVHTLNGSGVSIGRCIAAILENFQDVDGCVKIPEVLVPLMEGDFL